MTKVSSFMGFNVLRLRRGPAGRGPAIYSGLHSFFMTVAGLPNLARIPAGEFLMGAADADADERPVRRVYVSEFLIGRFPVTNDEYARFVRATNHRPPAVFELPLVAAGRRETLFREIAPQYAWSDGEPPPGLGSHPVVLVRY